MVKKTDSDTKVTEIEGKILSITGLAANSELSAVENKIPDISSLVKKTDFNTKATEIESKIPDVSSLVKKTDLDARLKKISDRVTKNKAKHLLVQNELKKLQKFDSAFFKDKSHFKEDGTHNYLVFQSMYRYFRRIIGAGSGNYIYFWKSIGLSDERLNSNTAFNYKITPELNYYGTKIKVEFNGSCLQQDEVTYNPGKIGNIYIVYEISKNYSISTYPTLESCLFGAISLTKNADIDKCKYSGYGIGFDRQGEFSFDTRGFGRNCIIFGVDLSSSSNANNKKKNILVLGKDFVQGISGTTIYAEKLYSINFTENNKKFCLSLDYNGVNSFLFVNRTEIYKFKAKDSEIVARQLCLGNISKDFSVDNMK